MQRESSGIVATRAAERALVDGPSPPAPLKNSYSKRWATVERRSKPNRPALPASVCARPARSESRSGAAGSKRARRVCRVAARSATSRRYEPTSSGDRHEDVRSNVASTMTGRSEPCSAAAGASEVKIRRPPTSIARATEACRASGENGFVRCASIPAFGTRQSAQRKPVQ